MPEIRQLSPHVADMIAAGEVVERPASVVKELIENAVDAAATTVTLEIRRGGMSFIRVTDNGCGMSPKDARMAFLRHATSKLRDERGLEAIGTLGFRGEALAAIASVSRIELLTREPDAAEGTRLVLEAGTVAEESPAGCPVGTTIIVRDLFYNTPARLKFMKTDRAETSAVNTAALHCALARPQLSLRYIRDGQEAFHTPGDSNAASAVYTLLGREVSAGMLKAEGETEGVKVSGFVCAPYAARGNRTMQLFFVNGRPVKSLALQAALEQAYKNRLFVGKFPAAVLYIELSPAAVDVNVHPAKTEVRFLREKDVFDAVYYTVMGALERETGGIQVEIGPSTKKVLQGTAAETAPEAGAAGSAPTYTAPAAKTPAPSGGVSGRVSIPAGGFVSAKVGEGAWAKSAGGFVRAAAFKEDGGGIYQTGTAPRASASTVPAADTPKAKEHRPEQTELHSPEPDWRIAGEALSTYIIVEKGDSLILIDKHAAHERIIFDRLVANRQPVMSQSLLVPLILRMQAEDAALILENTGVMAEYGFDVQPVGDGSIALRAVPADVDLIDAEGTLEMIADELRQGSAAPESARDAVLHTVACKAAIKAGRRSEARELEKLAEAVLSGKVRYCPHGRPVSVTLTKYELDKQFKRV